MRILFLRVILFLGVACLWCGHVMGQVYASDPQPECVDSINMRPWPKEDTAWLRLRVQGPSGDVSPQRDARRGVGSAWIQMRFLDSGIAYDMPLLWPKRLEVDLGDTVAIRVPKGRRLGVAAFSNGRGFDEAIIEPLTLASGDTDSSDTRVREVTLRLPHRQPPGQVSYQSTTDGGTASRRQDAQATLRLPLTGIVIARSSTGFNRSLHLFAVVPPGEYRLEVDPYTFRGCGESPISCPNVASWEQLVAANPPARTRVVRGFSHGVQLRACFELRDATPEQIASIERDRSYLEEEWWSAGAKQFDPGRLLVSVTLAKWNESTKAYARPRPVQWITASGKSDASVAPLAVDIASSSSWEPGRYRVEVTGPMVKTAVFHWDAPLKARGRPANLWQLEIADE